MQAVPYSDAIGRVESVEIEHGVIERLQILIIRCFAVEIPHEAYNSLPDSGFDCNSQVGTRHGGDVRGLESPDPQPEGRARHEDVPGRKSGTQDSGYKVRCLRRTATERGAEVSVRVYEISFRDSRDRSWPALQVLSDDEEWPFVNLALPWPLSFSLIEHWQLVRDEEVTDATPGKRQTVQESCAPAAISERQAGLQ